jgi:uncharacterized repeat protein (TIGR04138 family)
MQALWFTPHLYKGAGFTQEKLKRSDHVSGRELLEGIREFGLEQYGPMTLTVFQHWGIRTTEDFGEIVFNLVENGLLKKTEEDSRADFKNVYDFKEVFDNKELFRLDK